MRQAFESKFGEINVDDCAELNPKCIKMKAESELNATTSLKLQDEMQVNEASST